MDTEEYLHLKLFENTDIVYREFHSALMPTVDQARVIGVRVPILRKIAKELNKGFDTSAFLDTLPHKYYEEDNIHAFLIEQIKSFDECIIRLERFLPFVDNWATCDMMKPSILISEPEKLYKKIGEWLKSPDPYAVRFAVRMLMLYFLDERYTPEVFELVLSVDTDEYYLKMMTAWFFATAAVTRYDDVLSVLKDKRLDTQTHNKTIQKCIESSRISAEQKAMLKTLKLPKC